ncbi:hypothetical protein PSQ33_006096, partial [Pseudomonas aeruginosa]|nr:hypothetical protein [Pseudomonas aeruginosa]ELF1012760.1 hypothetical protein [Pseudomonas aeruginosa]
FKAAALIDLSTVADIEISNPPWVKFQSAGWVNFPSAPTAQDAPATEADTKQHSQTDADKQAAANTLLKAMLTLGDGTNGHGLYRPRAESLEFR